jgi:hypothetical protein
MNDELIVVTTKTRWAYTTHITEYTVTIAGVIVLNGEAFHDTWDDSKVEADLEVRHFLKRLALAALDQVL